MPIEQQEKQVDLTVIAAPADPTEAPDTKALQETKAYELAKKDVELEGLRQDLKERKDYAKKIYELIRWWLIGMFALLVAQGFLPETKWFNLGEAVIMAAIGGTTLNVLGIFIIVVNYLFPKRGS